MVLPAKEGWDTFLRLKTWARCIPLNFCRKYFCPDVSFLSAKKVDFLKSIAVLKSLFSIDNCCLVWRCVGILCVKKVIWKSEQVQPNGVGHKSQFRAYSCSFCNLPSLFQFMFLAWNCKTQFQHCGHTLKIIFRIYKRVGTWFENIWPRYNRNQKQQKNQCGRKESFWLHVTTKRDLSLALLWRPPVK